MSKERRPMPLEIITKEDLEEFKEEFFRELKRLLPAENLTMKRWLKSSEVRKLLSISPGTLQNLRISGVLRFTKVGGTMYYKAEDINSMLGGNH